MVSNTTFHTITPLSTNRSTQGEFIIEVHGAAGSSAFAKELSIQLILARVSAQNRPRDLIFSVFKMAGSEWHQVHERSFKDSNLPAKPLLPQRSLCSLHSEIELPHQQPSW